MAKRSLLKLTVLLTLAYLIQTGLASGPATQSGLLLGLTGVKDNDPATYRSMWIAPVNGKITCSVRENGIVTPYGEGFWEVKVRRIQESKRDPDALDKVSEDIRYFEYQVDVEQVYAHPLGRPAVPRFDRNQLPDFVAEKEGYPQYSYQTYWRQLLYVGNRYLCLREQRKLETGGSMRAGFYTIRLYEIGQLNPLGKDRQVLAFLGGDVQTELKELQGRHDRIVDQYRVGDFIQTETTESIDKENISIGRLDGKWYAYVPVNSTFLHNGNGSFFNRPKEFIRLKAKLPASLTSHDELCQPWAVIKERIPSALDAVSSPGRDLLAVLTDQEILVFESPFGDLRGPNLRIPVRPGEFPILNQWATGKYVEKWQGMLGKYFTAR